VACLLIVLFAWACGAPKEAGRGTPPRPDRSAAAGASSIVTHSTSELASAPVPWPTWNEDLDTLAARLWWSREALARAEGMTREPRRVAR
jgi:hypothetical protein